MIISISATNTSLSSTDVEQTAQWKEIIAVAEFLNEILVVIVVWIDCDSSQQVPSLYWREEAIQRRPQLPPGPVLDCQNLSSRLCSSAMISLCTLFDFSTKAFHKHQHFAILCRDAASLTFSVPPAGLQRLFWDCRFARPSTCGHWVV